MIATLIDIAQALPSQTSLVKDLKAGTDQSLYRIDFSSSDTNSFLITHHKPALATSNARIKQVEKLLPTVTYASRVSLFFIVDNLLVRHLDNAIKQRGAGRLPASWKIALPDSAVTHWPSNMQTQMVAGSIDIYNTLLHSLHEKPLHGKSPSALCLRYGILTSTPRRPRNFSP